MAFCYHCGKELREDAGSCENCGAQITAMPQSDISQTPSVPAVKIPERTAEDYIKEEQEFLDNTRRLLNWERKAWKICGMVLVILGAAFAAFFSLFGMLFTIISITDDTSLLSLAFVYFFYAIIYASIFIPVGVVELCASRKIPYYLDTLYRDIRPTVDRCGSVGMLIFSIFFGEVALVFFLINFIRMKCNKDTIARIIARQQKQ